LLSPYDACNGVKNMVSTNNCGCSVYPNNKFHAGSLPARWGASKSLRYLQVSQCNVTGVSQG
jgi:hypothetical protein